ncbi:type IV pilin-like G/H family protein [Geminocystis sp. GBBB08]|uniref:type IV pilin-like G/H family protein n=1 Tax=Geminocystis sp. GBBB08 TaxID=2604140 RepID=UPI0027E37201|nr:type IV pilin-like G/H family protein [Geminocystis sp. GBBB08]MBL1209750.1 hypothetical protein [Geminocystis sp. GBBB08]
MNKFSKHLLRNGLIAVVVGSGVLLGVGLTTQAQNNLAQDQNTALQAVAKMTEGQRTYYQKNGKFRAVVKNIQKDFGITLPNTLNYAVRTTSEAAYSYIIPAKSGELRGYVGAAFLTPNQTPKITTIICENNDSGQNRPADPLLVRDPLNTKKLSLQCGQFSVEVPQSQVNE